MFVLVIVIIWSIVRSGKGCGAPRARPALLTSVVSGPSCVTAVLMAVLMEV